MRDKIKFIEKLAESMNENKIESVRYEDNNFEVSLTKKEKKEMLFLAVQWLNLQRQMFNKKQKRRKWLYQLKQ
ncbi:hypothetical protein [Leptotrichia hofstadii]|uniref:hypothetical protein n=1 Tax=Leptotrichia hofstadii TaxID=157688 RepID=UPI001E4A352C|nr:hypothetical protein [Leptotrichia hofstadii]